MKVLGISPLDKDSTVSVVIDGKIIFAAAEERFSRVKQQNGFPHLALQQALKFTEMSVDDFDIVTYPFLEAEQEQKIFKKNIALEKLFIDQFIPKNIKSLLSDSDSKSHTRANEIHGLSNPNQKISKSWPYKLFYQIAGINNYSSKIAAKKGSDKWAEQAENSLLHWQQELETELQTLGIKQKLRRIEHHLSHAANSYFASGFKTALCITLDGYGTGLAGSISIAENGKFKRLHEIKYPHSLGTFYEQVTSSLGYKPSRHEGKIVGLAAYGDAEVLTEVILNHFYQKDGDYKIYQANNNYFSRYLAGRYSMIDLAAAYQNVLEIVATKMVNYWQEKTGIDAVVLSGGVAANVKLNQRIFELDGVKNIFVYPNMGDGGCGTGAAMYFSTTNAPLPTMTNTYFGPEFSDEDIKSTLLASNLEYSQPENLANVVASLIFAENVIARFDGRMEYGPRALGNRSIMYHGKEPEVNQWLNKRLGRTEFMPFAPVTLYEHREACYHNIKGAEHSAEFMTITFDCTAQMKQQCPAAVHVDGTARPQLIRREVNPGYYDILNEFYKLSGIPSLINTSFNMHEEPIVCTPQEAIKAFLQGGIDYLVLGRYLIKHPDKTG